MNRFFYFLVCVFFITSCSSSSNVTTNVETVEANTAVANKSIAAARNQPEGHVEMPVNANKIIIQNSTVSKDNVRNWEGKRAGSKENTPIAPNVSQMVIAAPDNSEVISQMNDKGQPLETRIFKKHPTLAKIERIDLDNRNIKVYLKNGKVVNLPEDRAANFLTAPADDILKAVGLK